MVKQNQMFIGLVVVAALLLATGTIKLGTIGAIGSGSGGSGGNGGAQGILATTQTISNATYDFAKPGTAVTNAAVKDFLNPSAGQLNPGGLVTSPGKTYTLFATATGYSSNIQTITTDYSPSPSVSFSEKYLDVPTLVGYDNDGVSKITGTENLTIGASGVSTLHLKVSQTTPYRFLTGDSKKLGVLVNVTNGQQTNYDPSQMSAIFDGAPCVALGSAGLANTAVPAALGGTLLTGFVCNNADFSANDGSLHSLDVKFAAASGVNPGAQNTTGVALFAIDTYQDSVSGALMTAGGMSTNSGAAINTNTAIAIPVD